EIPRADKGSKIAEQLQVLYLQPSSDEVQTLQPGHQEDERIRLRQRIGEGVEHGFGEGAPIPTEKAGDRSVRVQTGEVGHRSAPSRPGEGEAHGASAATSWALLERIEAAAAISPAIA